MIENLITQHPGLFFVLAPALITTGLMIAWHICNPAQSAFRQGYWEGQRRERERLMQTAYLDGLRRGEQSVQAKNDRMVTWPSTLAFRLATKDEIHKWKQKSNS